MKKNVVALIGIRSGSKSIKDKNIINFRGKPLVYWIIKAAKKSKLVDRVIISTDSKKYRDLCLSYGAEVPFLRPKKISGSNALEKDYLLHCLKWLETVENYHVDIVTRLQATSPLQIYSDIDKSIRILKIDNKATSSMVVAKSFQPPEKALKLEKNNQYLKPFYEKVGNPKIVNRQKLITAYYRSNIITTCCKNFLKTGDQIGNRSRIVEIPQERSIDINSKFDLFLAEQVAIKYNLCNE